MQASLTALQNGASRMVLFSSSHSSSALMPATEAIKFEPTVVSLSGP